MNDTIIAVCTAPGLSALALLRLDGPAAVVIAAQLVSAKKATAIASASSHSIVYGHIVDGAGQLIDQVLFLIMHAPRTFSGNQVVEITCHNNKFIIQAIIARTLALGARSAQPGEFTQRAVLNGKIDMLQAEAIHELIMAPSQTLARASLAQLEGSLSQVIMTVEERLFELAALIEASFEFSEEEHIDLDFDAVVRERIAQVVSYIELVCAGQSSVQQLRDGVFVALVGAVNAGKSTVLNTLLGRARAIVSDKPGTTRDSIEAGVTVDGYSWTYVDTAGLRDTDDLIEQEGIVRSGAAAAAADIVVLLADSSVVAPDDVIAQYHALVAQYGFKIILVKTKCDVGDNDTWMPFVDAHRVITISAKTGHGVESLRALIFEQVKAMYAAADAPFVLNKRQLDLINTVLGRLNEVAFQCQSPRPQYEVIAAHVHEILRLVTELSGRSITEQVMDKVFSTFCIGK